MGGEGVKVGVWVTQVDLIMHGARTEQTWVVAAAILVMEILDVLVARTACGGHVSAS